MLRLKKNATKITLLPGTKSEYSIIPETGSFIQLNEGTRGFGISLKPNAANKLVFYLDIRTHLQNEKGAKKTMRKNQQ